MQADDVTTAIIFSNRKTTVRELTTKTFAYIPNAIAAGLIFFIGLVIAKIVRRIVERVSGTVEVSTPEGGGLLVRIELPAVV